MQMRSRPLALPIAASFLLLPLCLWLLLGPALTPVAGAPFEQGGPRIITLPPHRLSHEVGAEVVRPAVEAVLHRTLFDLAGKAGALILSNDLKDAPIPDFDSTINVPILGDCDFIFRNGTLNWLYVPPELTSVDLSNNYMSLTLANISFEVEMDFRYEQQRWPHVRSHGHAIMHGFDGNATGRATFFIAEGGVVQLYVLDSETHFDDIRVEISDSKAAWLYNAVTALFRNHVKDSINAKLDQEVDGSLPSQANKLFATMPTLVDVLGTPLNTSFKAPIAISPIQTIAHMFGVFQTVAGPCPYASTSPFGRLPSDPPSPVAQSSSARMLTLRIHQSLGQCFLWSLARTHFFDRRIDKLTTPSAPPEIISSATWAKIVPAVADVYGTDRDVSLETRLVGSEPSFRVSEEVEIFVRALELSVYVFDRHPAGPDAGRTLAFAFLVDLSVAASPTVSVDDGVGKFGMELEDADVSAELLKSAEELGIIDMERVNLSFKAALGSASEQLQDLVDEHPIELPNVPFVDLMDANILAEDEIISLSVDVGYHEK